MAVAQVESSRLEHELDWQGRVLYVEERAGSKRGGFWLKHCLHGLHWVQMRSLPVSAILRASTGGVPTETFIRYSPELGITVDSIVGARVKRVARAMERRKASRRRSKCVVDGS